VILYEFCRYTKRYGIRSIVDQLRAIQSKQQKNHLYRNEFCYPVHLTPLGYAAGQCWNGSIQTPESHVRQMRNIGKCYARYNPGGLQKYQEKVYQAHAATGTQVRIYFHA
jgi:hypothetical protein